MGIVCDASGFVTQFHTTTQKIVGTIPPQLASLTRLQILNVADNALYGTIPVELTSLSSLTELCAALPSAFCGLLVSHEHRSLKDSRLACPRADGPRTAPLPASRARFSSALICRLLFQNQLTGSIPPQLGNMTRLQQMCARFERLSVFVAQPVYAHPVGLRCRHVYAL